MIDTDNIRVKIYNDLFNYLNDAKIKDIDLSIVDYCHNKHYYFNREVEMKDKLYTYVLKVKNKNSKSELDPEYLIFAVKCNVDIKNYFIGLAIELN